MNKKVLLLFWVLYSTLLVRSESVVLLAPEDDAVDVSASPTFIWDLLPGNLYSYTLKYVFTIAEYDPEIGATASLITNQVYTDDILDDDDNITYPYPVSAPELDTCTAYVWQVKVYYITIPEEEPFVPVETLLAVSDIFHFSTSCSSEVESFPSQTNKIYMLPRKTLDNFVYLIEGDSLWIKYQEYYAAYSLAYNIKDGQQNIVADSSIGIIPGLNYLAIPIGPGIDESSASMPRIYTLELHTPKGEILRAKFEKQEEE